MFSPQTQPTSTQQAPQRLGLSTMMQRTAKDKTTAAKTAKSKGVHFTLERAYLCHS